LVQVRLLKPNPKWRANAMRTSERTRECPRVTAVVSLGAQKLHLQAFSRSPLTDSNRRPPPYHGGFGLSTLCRRFAFTERFRRKLSSSAARRSLPQHALNLPEKPRTCPQNLSPRWPSSVATACALSLLKHRFATGGMGGAARGFRAAASLAGAVGLALARRWTERVVRSMIPLSGARSPNRRGDAAVYGRRGLDATAA
jgi:hypothetical protein